MLGKIRNLPWFKTLRIPGAEAFGAKIHETLSDISERLSTIEQQGNFNTAGEPIPPNAVNGIQVSGRGGYIHVAVTDQNQNLYRGVHYFVEHADNQNFTNPQIVPMGTARNVTIPVGNQTRYVRAYSAYPWSAISPPVIHGGAQPIAVSGGGADSGPLFLGSQGSGTGAAGVGLSGPGPIPFRSASGGPPVR